MANVNLRGLNLSATLVMVNSRRNTLAGLPAESGDSYVDTVSYTHLTLPTSG